MVKLVTLPDCPRTTEPNPKLRMEAERLAGDVQEPATQVPPVEHVVPLSTQILATQQPPPVQVVAAQQG